MKETDKHRIACHRIIAAAVSAWFMFLAVDFMLHAVIFAKWWRTTESYWLTPIELFRMIPYGYASFAIYCLVLTWLFVRVYGAKLTFGAACRFGGFIGLALGFSIILGNYAVFRVPVSALLVWPASYGIESTVACVAARWVLIAERPWRRAGLAFGVAVLLLIVSVVFQNLLYPASTSNVFSK